MQETLDRYLSFLQQDKHNFHLLLDISSLYAELNDLDNAQDYLNQAKTINYEECLAAQGLLHLKQNEIPAAQEYLQKAVQHQDSPDLNYALGFSYYLDNKLDQAWMILTSIQDPEYSALAQQIMARILYQQDNIEGAIALLEAYSKQFPNDAEGLGFLSLLYFDNNNELLAQEFSQRALQLDSSVYDAQVVDIMLRLPHKETSSEEIKNLLEMNPSDTRLLFALGSSYMTEGDFSSAESYFYNALTIHPDFYDCYVALAWCQLLDNKISEAHKTYQNAIEVADYLADAWGGLAIIYGLSDELEQAEQLISKAQSLNSECFLTEIAQVIYLTYKAPEKAQQQLFQTLTNQQLAVSEKLALIIEQM